MMLEQDLAELADDPIGSPSQTAILHLAKCARGLGVKVIQVGEGSDEVFFGYSSAYQLWQFHRRFAHLHRLLPRRVAGFLAQAFGSRFEHVAINQSRSGSMDGTLLEHLRRYASCEHVYWGFGILFCERDQERLYGNVLPSSANPYQWLRLRLDGVSDFDKRPYLDQLTITDLVLELPERLLMRLDKGLMLYSIEAREPFLDTNVLKAAFRVPQDLRAAGHKAALKAYASSKLPPEILTRPKKGFPSDSRIFMCKPVMSRIRESVLSKRFLAFTGFAPSRLQEFIAVSETGRAEFFPHLWSIYVLSLWFHRWIEGNK